MLVSLVLHSWSSEANFSRITCFGSFDFAAGAVETAGAGATAGPVDTAEAGVSAGPGDAIGAEAWLEAAYLRL